MKTVSILVPESAVAEAVSNPRYIFTTANQFLLASGQPELFKVELVGATREVRVHDGYCSMHTDKLLEEVSETDLIIIPALFGDVEDAIKKNRQMLPWIVEHRNKGAEVASLCLGAFLLAATDLLKGKKCSTHWAFYQQFRTMYPDVDLQDGSIITEEDGIYSSGGANSYFNLLLYLLEKYANRDVAILASKYFAIDIDRSSQAAFTIFQGQKEHNDKEVKKAQSFIEKNYVDRITVDDIADRVALSRRSLERRFKKATNNTLVEYIQRVKIEAAKRNFECTRKNISEVMFDVGYVDNKSFRTVFKKITGLTPNEYRNKYQKGILEVA
ncbi:MAG: helix-turn-helix domain-containing protein [Fulvivirga sp.]